LLAGTACLFRFVLLRPPRPPLFPYTTLFRSGGCSRSAGRRNACADRPAGACADGRRRRAPLRDAPRPGARHGLARALSKRGICRSEEHTSELQSRENLVCRLLLEKKKAQTST